MTRYRVQDWITRVVTLEPTVTRAGLSSWGALCQTKMGGPFR